MRPTLLRPPYGEYDDHVIAAIRSMGIEPIQWDVGEFVRAGDALTDTLSEKQKEIFEYYMTAQREVNVITDCETFALLSSLAQRSCWMC